MLADLEPDRDPSALAYAVRTMLPLVQVPSEGVWGYSGKAPFTTPERWLGQPLSGSEEARDLMVRYLAAFGPAAVKDVQTWSGRTRLKPVMEEMRPELRTFRDESGNELFDLPDAPLLPRTPRLRPASCPTTTTSSSPTPKGTGRPRRAPQEDLSSRPPG